MKVRGLTTPYYEATNSTYTIHTKYMHRTCVVHAQYMHKTCTVHAQDMHSTHQNARAYLHKSKHKN